MFSWGKCARYLGFLAAGGCRRGWLLGARRLLGQPVHAVLAGAARGDHRGGAGTVLGSRRNSEAGLPAARASSAAGPRDSHPLPAAHAPSPDLSRAHARPARPPPRAGQRTGGTGSRQRTGGSGALAGRGGGGAAGRGGAGLRGGRREAGDGWGPRPRGPAARPRGRPPERGVP